MKNAYEVRGEVTAIFLKRRDGSTLETLIDTADLPRVQEFPGTWYANHNYVVGNFVQNNRRTLMRLHRWLINIPKGMVIDHINRNPLDNRRCNLRIVKPAENMQNQGAHRNGLSGIRGVYWEKTKRKWRANIRLNGKNKFIGYYDDINEAAEAASLARAKYMPYSSDASRRFNEGG